MEKSGYSSKFSRLLPLTSRVFGSTELGRLSHSAPNRSRADYSAQLYILDQSRAVFRWVPWKVWTSKFIALFFIFSHYLHRLHILIYTNKINNLYLYKVCQLREAFSTCLTGRWPFFQLALYHLRLQSAIFTAHGDKRQSWGARHWFDYKNLLCSAFWPIPFACRLVP